MVGMPSVRGNVRHSVLARALDRIWWGVAGPVAGHSGLGSQDGVQPAVRVNEGRVAKGG